MRAREDVVEADHEDLRRSPAVVQRRVEIGIAEGRIADNSHPVDIGVVVDVVGWLGMVVPIAMHRLVVDAPDEEVQKLVFHYCPVFVH